MILSELKEQREKDIVEELGKTIFSVNVNNISFNGALCIINVLPEFIKDHKIKVCFLSIPYGFTNASDFLEHKKEYIAIKSDNIIYTIICYELDMCELAYLELKEWRK